MKCVGREKHSSFETQASHYQKSKTGLSVAPQKGMMSSNCVTLKFLSNSYTLMPPVLFLIHFHYVFQIHWLR